MEATGRNKSLVYRQAIAVISAFFPYVTFPLRQSNLSYEEKEYDDTDMDHRLYKRNSITD